MYVCMYVCIYIERERHTYTYTYMYRYREMLVCLSYRYLDYPKTCPNP